MANDPRHDVVIDPALFFVPDDVIDVRAGRNGSSPEPDMPIEASPEIPNSDSPEETDSTEIDASIGSDSTTEQANALQTPQHLTIVSQEVRVSSDGRSVIDVTLDVEDIMGAIDYEIRVTK